MINREIKLKYLFSPHFVVMVLVVVPKLLWISGWLLCKSCKIEDENLFLYRCDTELHFNSRTVSYFLLFSIFLHLLSLSCFNALGAYYQNISLSKYPLSSTFLRFCICCFVFSFYFFRQKHFCYPLFLNIIYIHTFFVIIVCLLYYCYYWLLFNRLYKYFEKSALLTRIISTLHSIIHRWVLGEFHYIIFLVVVVVRFPNASSFMP